MKKRICFFAHNHKDGADNFKKLLKEKVIDLSHGDITVIYDKDDFNVSDDVYDKESIIDEATTVVLFLSPSYKIKIDSKNDMSGSYREYKKIVRRLSKNKGFLIPVLVSGTIDTSIPDKLKKIIFQDATKYSIDLDKNDPYLKYSQEREISILVNRIIDRTNLLYKLGDPKYDNNREAINRLIHNNHSIGDLPSNCMVLIDAYQQIINNESDVFFGRKGSGKSTLKEIIENYDPQAFANQFKTLYPIKFEKMNIESLYELYSFISNSTNNLFRSFDIIQIYWELVFVIISIVTVIKDYEKSRITDYSQKIHIAPVYTKALELFSVNNAEEISEEAIFSLSRESIKKQYELFKNSEDTFRINSETTLVTNLSSIKIIKSLLSNTIFEEFERVVNRCQKHIMIFIDAFDVNSEGFGLKTKLIPDNEYQEKIDRTIFELDYYKNLVNVVSEIKENNRIRCLSKSHFCIILPEDRIKLIQYSDRDFIKRNISILKWDPVFLVQMINKRLAMICNIDEFPYSSDFKNFEYILENCYPSIPLKFNLITKKFESQIDLFTYLLSLSFWRPRDILIHMGYILAAIDNNKINNQTLRILLNNSSSDIIEHEFFKEFENIIYNLETIVYSFENKSIILSSEECYKTLNKIEFKLANKNNLTKFEDKMKLLYEIGFLGVIRPNNTRRRNEFGSEYCFIYNEGVRPFESINFESEMDNVKFIINHLFFNYLNLNYNYDKFIENYSKDYFISNHQLRSVIKFF